MHSVRKALWWGAAHLGYRIIAIDVWLGCPRFLLGFSSLGDRLERLADEMALRWNREP